MATTRTSTQADKWVAGEWEIDHAHSSVTFTVRHMMISRVRGSFEQFTGRIITTDDLLKTSATGCVSTASINTGTSDRDDHLRGTDFLDTEQHPTMDFDSTYIEERDASLFAHGEMTIRGVTKPVVFEIDLGGFAVDPWGNHKLALEARTTIERDVFGRTSGIRPSRPVAFSSATTSP